MSRYMIAGLALAAAAPGAHAGSITTFTDRTAWEAQYGTVTVEDFGPSSAFPITTGVLNAATDLVTSVGGPIQPGDIVDGVTFSTTLGPGNFFNIDFFGGFSGGFLDSVPSTGDRVLTLEFDTAQSGFGFVTNDLMDVFDVTITFADTTTYTGGFSAGATSDLDFFGFSSDATDIVSVVIDGTASTSGFNFALDDFSFTDEGTPPAVPVPASLPLLLAGVGAVAALRRARR